METTRHYTGTVYVVNGGATALHDHRKLGIRIPPGGHVDRDELPHEAALRECREETGLEATIITRDDPGPTTGGGRPLPQPRAQMLYDIDVVDGRVAHQHVDHVYFATAPSREIDPADGEAGADVWNWYSETDLRESDVGEDVQRFGIEAIHEAERFDASDQGDA
jgi:8-oxo-dGTP pyrophosphatase MutT (NUDIX family)